MRDYLGQIILHNVPDNSDGSLHFTAYTLVQCMKLSHEFAWGRAGPSEADNWLTDHPQLEDGRWKTVKYLKTVSTFIPSSQDTINQFVPHRTALQCVTEELWHVTSRKQWNYIWYAQLWIQNVKYVHEVIIFQLCLCFSDKHWYVRGTEKRYSFKIHFNICMI
jgi:hypothetical protein